MASMSAEDALARAKAIAARLSGQAAADNAPPPALPEVPPSSSISNGTTKTTTGKRKRWGVTPDALQGGNVPASVASSAATGTAATASAAVASALTVPFATASSSPTAAAAPVSSTAAPAAPTTVTKRVWISTNDKRPPSHFVAFLVDKIQPVLQELNSQQPDDNSNNDNDSSEKITIELQGRGSSSRPPLPGMPEQPLHVLITGPAHNKPLLEQAETKMEILIAQAEEAPVLERPDGDNGNPSGHQNDTNSALVALNSSAHAGASSLSSYKPASVAQMIGQATLSPETLLAQQTAEWREEEIQVPHGVVGFIIGRGGESISSMQAQTGCKVQIQKEHDLKPGQTQRTITLSATTQRAIDECREIIMNMVREKAAFLSGGSERSTGSGAGGTVGAGAGGLLTSSGGGSSSNINKDEQRMQEALAAGHVLVKVPVPDADVGLIIGKMGTTIRSIQDQSGANIQVPSAAEARAAAAEGTPADGPLMRTVSITHPTQQGADHAKQLIQNILNSRPSYAAAPGAQQLTIQVPIPDKDVGLCIGRQGCVIREMQNKSKTKIQIPSHPTPGQPHRIATVTGTKEGCEQVKQMINSIVMAQSSAPVLSPQAGYNNAGYGGPQQHHHHQQQHHHQGMAPQHHHHHRQYHGGGAASYGQQPQQQQQQQQGAGQEQYSAEWAAYHAAQAAAQQQQQQAAAPAAAQQQAAVPSVAAPAPAAQQQQQQQQPASDAYYEQFFRHEYYYGEEAARKHYGAWSPPVGTPNPYGVNPAGIQPAPATGTPAASAPASAPAPVAAPAPAAPAARETSRRQVSNLPAWMTKK